MRAVSMDCPRCRTSLQRQSMGRAASEGEAGPKRALWACDRCGGQAITAPVLRQESNRDRFNAFWQAARTHGRPGELACATCARPMATVALDDTLNPSSQADALVVDLCWWCHLIWFDPGEQVQLSGSPVTEAPPEQSLPPAARHALGQLAARRTPSQATRDRGRVGRVSHFFDLFESIFD